MYGADRCAFAPLQAVLEQLWNMSMQARAGEGMDYPLAKHVLTIYQALGSRLGPDGESAAAVYDTDFAGGWQCVFLLLSSFPNMTQI